MTAFPSPIKGEGTSSPLTPPNPSSATIAPPLPFEPARRVKHERLLPLIVATALFIENMDSTAIATSLPAIAQDFGVEPVALKLALTT